jgi:hypothetical protein
VRFKISPQLSGAGRTRAWHHHGSHTPTSPGAILLSKMACQPKHFGPQCTEVRFASLLSGGFITAIVVNPLEKNWQNAPLCSVTPSCQNLTFKGNHMNLFRFLSFIEINFWSTSIQQYVYSQNRMIYLENVGFLPNIYLILYPSLEDLTTLTAILQKRNRRGDRFDRGPT